jgi:hypothetical protein
LPLIGPGIADGQNACLFGAAGGTGGSNDGHADLNATGFGGN